MALRGVNVIELVGLAPAPFCGLILSDFGANVLRVDRVRRGMEASEPLRRGKKSMALDLKGDEGKKIFKDMCKSADVLIEPFRPGVMEKLGLGPTDLFSLNDKLIYTRMSGYGQTGPMALSAGHDLNYVGLTGLLPHLGPAEPAKPFPPMNFLADYAGGGLTAAFGILAALIERNNSGKGQVIDANLLEGAAYVCSAFYLTRQPDVLVSQLAWPRMAERGRNLLDGGAPYYKCYRTKDNKFMAVGSLEPQFYSNLMKGLGLDGNKYSQGDVDLWDKFEEEFQEIFSTKTQKEWVDVFTPLDCCVTPVVDCDGAPDFPHNQERRSFLDNRTPRPAPLLMRTPGQPSLEEPRFGQHTRDVLTNLGYSSERINQLVKDGIVALDEGEDAKSKL